MTDNELYWLAGLLEGEACFGWDKKGRTPKLVMRMTDQDVLERAAVLMCVNVFGPYRGTRKPLWEGETKRKEGHITADYYTAVDGLAPKGKNW